MNISDSGLIDISTANCAKLTKPNLQSFAATLIIPFEELMHGGH
jgi:hypothetical protein